MIIHSYRTDIPIDTDISIGGLKGEGRCPIIDYNHSNSIKIKELEWEKFC